MVTRAKYPRFGTFAALGVTVLAGGCGPEEPAQAEAMSAAMGTPSSPIHDGQELWGHYLQPEPWPNGLPDDQGHAHAG
ncbi:MAG: hypothetical protein AB7T31_10685 [Gemmatimonadales bacterium]